MPEDVPNCHGYTRAITVRAPEGSVVNPLMPAACGARGITGYRTIDCMFGALAQALPDRVAADNSGGSTLPTISGWRDGKPFVFCETFMGNTGASADHDGEEGVAHIGANQSNVPVEMIEAEYPIRIEHYGIMPDTGGPAAIAAACRWCAPIACSPRRPTSTCAPTSASIPRTGSTAAGAGAPSMNRVHRGDGTCEMLPVLLTRTVPMRKGDLFHHVMAGGGGYGDPLERDPELVLRGRRGGEGHARACGRGLRRRHSSDGPQPSVDAAATEAPRLRPPPDTLRGLKGWRPRFQTGTSVRFADREARKDRSSTTCV